ncbi:MAG: hypothetical protein ACRCX5_14310 [Bacteroidales bacterium]|uniref:hypothetical protein n=1 Tax=Clostridium chrysemydis TaxID=2665504 RepID=UPI003F3308AF
MKELNLVEILKDVPEGAEFYSTTYGNVVFDKINYDHSYYPIRVIIISEDGDRGYQSFTSNGKLSKSFNGECTLFPSKENRDWESFTYFPIKEGDSVMAGDSNKEDWSLAKYVKDNVVVISGKNTCVQYIVPAKDFDFNNIESNIHRSVV